MTNLNDLPRTTGSWKTVRRGDGKITGYIEVFPIAGSTRTATIPDVSRFIRVK